MAIELTTMTAEDRAALKAAIAGHEDVTSGASPVDCDLSCAVTAVTSGGTAGEEVVNLPNFPFTAGDYTNPAMFGTRHVVYLKELTDPADIVKVRINGGADDLYILSREGQTLGFATSDGAGLDDVGRTAVFFWIGYQWMLDQTADDNSTTILNKVKYVPSTSGVVDGSPLIFQTNVHWDSGGDAGLVNAVQFITTGASPVEANPNIHQTRITTGGTGGTETITFNNIPIGEAGAEHIFNLVTQTDPEDVVSIDPSHIKTAADAAIASIELTPGNAVLHVKMSVLGWWRVVEGTAAVTPA